MIKKSKKFTCMFLSVMVLVMTINFIPVKASSAQNIEIMSNEYPNAYFESEIVPVYQMSPYKSKLIYTINATVYVEEDGNESRLLSEDEVLKIGKENFSSFSAVGDDQTKKKLELGLNVFQDDEAGKKYTLKSYANWGTVDPDASTGPSVGEDLLGFAWGGEFDFKDQYITGGYLDGNNTNVTYTPAAHIPNVAYVWSYDELLKINREFAVGSATFAQISLVKNTLTGNGNTTSFMCQYIHTYEETSGSISVSTEDAGLSLSNVSKQWSLICTVSNIKY